MRLPVYFVAVSDLSGAGSDSVIKVEVMMVKLTQVPFPLSACPAPKEVNTESSGDHILTEG